MLCWKLDWLPIKYARVTNYVRHTREKVRGFARFVTPTQTGDCNKISWLRFYIIKHTSVSQNIKSWTYKCILMQQIFFLCYLKIRSFRMRSRGRSRVEFTSTRERNYNLFRDIVMLSRKELMAVGILLNFSPYRKMRKPFTLKTFIFKTLF
jgi:hypothetical protein